MGGAARWSAMVLLAYTLMTIPALAFVEGEASSGEDSGLLYLEAGTFDPLAPVPDPSSALMEMPPIEEGESSYYIVQFHGRVREEWKKDMLERGASILGYIPRNAFLVECSREAAERVREMGEVRWVGSWWPQLKLSEGLRERLLREWDAGRERTYTAILFPGVDLDDVLARFEGIGVKVVQVVEMPAEMTENSLVSDRVVFEGSAEDVFDAARCNSISWIEPLLLPELRNNATQWVIQSNISNLRSIWQERIFGVGQIIGHIDARIDINSCYFRDDQNPIGPDHRKIVAYRSSNGFGSDAHGTHTGGIAVGDATYTGESWTYDGMAPGARLSFTNYSDVNNSNLAQYLFRAYRDGARVHTNSWGNDGTTSYTQWCRDIDQVSHDYEDNLVCFAVTNMNTLRTPENAKNVLAVGATRHSPDQDRHCTGGRGPTDDGRLKPEIYAPGCNTLSVKNGQDCETQSMSGTSMASPAIAGAGALVRDYFENGWYPTGSKQPEDSLTPTGSLVKAALLNSAVDLTGEPTYPSILEGWGRVLLENVLYFEGDPERMIIRDVRMTEGLTTGAGDTLLFNVAGSAVPLKVTLVWHDYPASVGATFTPVNNLDLSALSPEGTEYRGNVFSHGQSAPGGAFDPLNNVEQVHIDMPGEGEWRLVVQGTEVNMGPQGYALVITGDVSDGSERSADPAGISF